MHTPPETSPPISRKKSKSNSSIAKKLGLWFLFIFLWASLISGGIYGAYYYLEQIKADIISEVNDRYTKQMDTLKEDYGKQIDDVKEKFNEHYERLKAEVQTLNQLLIFTQDSLNTDHDNSNQLYTQLQNLQQQLNELKKNLEVLE